MASDNEFDEELEQAYNAGLAFQEAGENEKAIACFEQCLRLDPDDCGGASLRLAALGAAGSPDVAPPAYISVLFDQHAEEFEEILVDQLGYDVPMQARNRIQEMGIFGPFARMLDLGCGTGLAGEAFEEACDILVAVDLSEEMVGIAAQRGCYDDLYIGEIVNFMQTNDEEPFDFIIATDLMPYLGALEGFFAAIDNVAAAHCTLVFSTETQNEEYMQDAHWKVGPHHRYAHAPSYIGRKLEEAGFKLLTADDIVVRYEEGAPVSGQLIIAKRGA